MWWTTGLDRDGPAVWTAEPEIWTAELDRRNYCTVLCVKPILRSTEPVLWSILRSDPRSTPWSIPNGFAHTLTHMYIPPHPCSMAMISHPCTICALDVLRIILSHSCITICVFLYVCVCTHSPASSQQCSSRCSQGGASGDRSASRP